MKFIAERSAILPSLVRAARAANPKSALSALGLVQLDARDSFLRVAATDLEVGSSTSLGAVVLAPGHWGVSAKGLLERVKNMPETALTFSADGKPGSSESLKITAPRTQRSYTMRAIPGADLPTIEQPPKKVIYTFPIEVVLPCLTAVRRAVSEDVTRQHLSSAWLEMSDVFSVGASDGHRLHVDGPPAVGTTRLVPVPIHALGHLLALLADVGEGPLEVRESSTTTYYGAGGMVLSVKRVGDSVGRPRYDQVIPKTCPTIVRADRRELIAAVKVCMVTAKIVSVAATKGEMRLTSEMGGDEGDCTDAVPCEIKGPEFGGKVGLLGAYLVDMLESVSSERVALGFGGELDPVKVVDGNFTGVIMPTRI